MRRGEEEGVFLERVYWFLGLQEIGLIGCVGGGRAEQRDEASCVCGMSLVASGC